LKWQPPSSLQKHDRILGRGGWVSTRNYELVRIENQPCAWDFRCCPPFPLHPEPPLFVQDSGAYFLHLLYDLYLLPGYGHSALLREPVVFEAASLLLRVWTTEQQHEAQSEYRYAELPRDGRGAPSNYTGMSWSGFRPSDDQQQYGFNIPVNMYAVAAVERACELNKALWKDRDFGRTAAALAESMREGD
jgi:meiotically up-regulated gene 157 (Mug157) protein